MGIRKSAAMEAPETWEVAGVAVMCMAVASAGERKCGGGGSGDGDRDGDRDGSVGGASHLADGSLAGWAREASGHD